MGIRGATGTMQSKQRVLTPSAHRPLGHLEGEDPHPYIESIGTDRQTINKGKTVFTYYQTNFTTNGSNEVKLKGDFGLGKLKNLTSF